jgi:nitroimidazol reductase NimA-like FMN-containing flavoprotein (pyridoxamine 5'-phosphate oxidase superfamily)
MHGTLTITEIEDVLSKQILARIGCHYDNRTYVVPISYAYDGTHFYCHSYEGMKTQMMRKNPKVCLQIDDMINMADWKSVVCWGDAIELTKEEEQAEAIKHLVARKLPLQSSETTHLFSDWPFSNPDEKLLPGALFCIKVIEKTGRFERTTARDQRHNSSK